MKRNETDPQRNPGGPIPLPTSDAGLTRETFKHTAIYGSSGFLGKLVGFIMLPVYAHALGTAGYGIIGMVEVSLAFAGSLLAYSVSGSIVRLYYEEPEGQGNRVISTGVLLAGAGTLLVASLGVLISRPLSGLLLGDPSLYGLLCLALATFVLDVTAQAATTILLIRRRSLAYSLISLSRVVIGLPLNIWLIVILKLGVLGYFISNLAVAIVAATAFLSLCLRQTGLTFDREVARRLLKFQLPLVPSSVLAWFSGQVEKIIVRFRVDITGVGVLAMAGRFPMLIQMLVVWPFLRAFGPMRTELAEKDRESARVSIGKMYSSFLYVLLFAGLLIAVNIDTLLHLIAPEDFGPSARIARVVVVTTLLMASSQYLTFGVYFDKATKLLATIHATNSVVKTALSFVFVWTWGIAGAAYAGCVAAVISLLWGASAGQKRFPLVLEHRTIVRMIVSAAGLFLGIAYLPWTSMPGFQELSLWLATHLATPAVVLFGGAEVVPYRMTDALLLLVKTLLCLSFLLVSPEMRRRLIRLVRRAGRGGAAAS